MNRAAWALVGLCALAGGASLIATSCTQSAVNVPVRTFERAQRVDVVCLKVLGPSPDNPAFQIAIPPQAAPQAECAPVPPNVDGSGLPYHLYALVTQTARGEVAVVDLTAGRVVDGDHSTPGINFIPVGALPTDVAVSPDGRLAFVSTAEVNKPAIYAISTQEILGDSQGLPPDVLVEAGIAPPALPALPVCALPQAPSTMVVVPRGDTYDIAVVLPGDGRTSAKVVTLDPAPFIRAAGAAAGDAGPGDAYAPGQLTPCAFSGTVELAGALPPPPAGAAVWGDGLPYAVDAAPPEPAPSPKECTGEGGAPEAGPSDAGAAEGGADAGAADSGDAGGLAFGPGLKPHATRGARDGTTLYVADDGVPFVHVIDLAKRGAPKERPPLVATSQADPARRVSVGDIAVSPTTSDYKRYLYGIDKKDGSIIVFDVTDLTTAPRPPLLRPHPEVNPFQPPDRIIFNVPVAAVSFVRHDFPLTHLCDVTVTTAKSGVLCNPNPNAGPDLGPPTPTDLGFGMCYRANAQTADVPGIGPFRLRGVFGFATLSNGQVVAIDIDDWDAPCRRPDPSFGTDKQHPVLPLSAITPPEPPPAGPDDLDPYHVPVAFQGRGSASSPVTLEEFFPVSAPHRPRSYYFLRNDPTGGVHAPQLNGVPQLFSANNSLPTSGPQAIGNPLMLPTATALADPSYTRNPTEPDPAKRQTTPRDPTDPALSRPSDGPERQPPAVRFAWEDPQVHLDQDWTVTYEGAIPGFDGTTLATPVVTTDQYQTVLLTNPAALFCRKGVEDYRIGAARAATIAAEMPQFTVVPPPRLDHKIADYVQLTDEILDPGDPYWAEDESVLPPEQRCWDDLTTASPAAKHDTCVAEYGAAADQSVQRDFPILEAYEDRLVLGRFGYTTPIPATTSREVVGADPGNARALKRMRCCFHRQVRFRVRTGGMWLTVGSSVGHLHRVTADANNACVLSCVPREALLNARAPGVPWPTNKDATPPARKSALALRNPAFSFVVWDGRDAREGDVPPARDLQWKFTTRGQFAPLLVNIASTTTAVSPQSMRFIDSLGQLALVDGASQGLVLIDLNTVTLAHTPFF